MEGSRHRPQGVPRRLVSRYRLGDGPDPQHGCRDGCPHRGTWLSFKNKQNLKILVEGDRRLFNQYGVMLVNPEKHPHVKRDLGEEFINWLASPTGQQTIADYRIDGAQLFFPDAAEAPR